MAPEAMRELGQRVVELLVERSERACPENVPGMESSGRDSSIN